MRNITCECVMQREPGLRGETGRCIPGGGDEIARART